MKTCFQCKSEIHSEAKLCPMCRSRQPSGVRGRVIFISLVSLAALALFGRCSRPDPPPFRASEPAAQSNTTPTVLPAERSIDHHALAVCRALQNAGAQKCELNSLRQTIEATINVSLSDAATLCRGVVSLIQQQTTAFNGTAWQIQVFSPSSGLHPLATCKLSQAP